MKKRENVLSVLQEIRDILKGKPAMNGPTPKPQPRVINGRFTDNGDGTVYDNLKKITIVRRPHTDLPDQFKNEMNFADREAACKALRFADKSNWRQPTRDELESLRDFTKFNPCVDTDIFPDIKPSWYGTGEEVQGYSDYAWCVDFGIGSVNYFHKVFHDYVWPVRSSQ